MSALKLYQVFQKTPISSLKQLAQILNLTIPTVTKAKDNLIKLGIVKEITGRSRNQLFAYSDYIKILSEDSNS